MQEEALFRFRFNSLDVEGRNHVKIPLRLAPVASRTGSGAGRPERDVDMVRDARLIFVRRYRRRKRPTPN
jgi:ribosomal protein L16/L10AE